jgi:hypothetical protein
MKKIDTTNITGLQGAPFLKATHDHYKEAMQEINTSTVKALLDPYAANDVIILYGCDVTVTSGSIPGTGTATLSAGAIYYNDEIYQVDANAGLSTTNPQTLIWSIDTSYRAGDPVEWSDGPTRDMHQIDKFLLSAGTAGTGLANYDAATVKRFTSLVAVVTSLAAINLALGGLTTTVIEIGNWDMQGTASVTISHGLDDAKIRSISVIIRADSGSIPVKKLDNPNSSASTGFDGSVIIGNSDVTLTRDSSGGFSSTSYDNVSSYNRGWITIAYAD